MIRNTTLAVLATLAMAASSFAAPIVTMVESTLTRTPTPGAGQYKVLDFFLTNSVGAEFTNYRLTAAAALGSLFDPARLQDDRQQNNAVEANGAGSVDTWANTVMSAAAKDDGGFNSSITPNIGSYIPAGTSPAPAFQFLDWSVFDTKTNDDNDLNDYPVGDGGPFAVTAPYHIARILASVESAGTATFQAFDTISAGVPTVFNFNYGIPEPATVSLLGLALVGCFGFIRRR